MDYVPPPKPAIVSYASKRLIAEDFKPDFCWQNMGMLDSMPTTFDWDGLYMEELWPKLHDFKPGQRLEFAKPHTAARPIFYIEQHLPCSPATLEAFERFVHEEHARRLDRTALKPIQDLLGKRITDKLYDTAGVALDHNGHPILFVHWAKPLEKTYSEAFFVVADKKRRLIQEIGYEGARGTTRDDDPWGRQAHEMLMRCDLKPES